MTIDDAIDLTADQQVALAQQRRRRRRWAARALSIVVAVLLVSGAGLVYIRRPATAVTIDDALANFRTATTGPSGQAATADASQSGATVEPEPSQQAAGSQPAGGGVTPEGSTGGDSRRQGPAPGAGPRSQRAEGQLQPPSDGVYEYDTKGYEYTDALGGSRHDYPARTALTVRLTSCGFIQRWQPLEERWDESEHCLEGGGVSIKRFSTFHSFFQRSIRQDYPCPAGQMVYPADPVAGKRWSITCAGDAGKVVMAANVVGPEDVSIGGKTVRTIRVHYDATMTGANRGQQIQDRWFHPESGMNVRIDTEIRTESDSPFGAINYEEKYTITAASLTPRR